MSVYEFRLPDVGEGISEAEIVEWHVAEGSTVREDQPLVTIQTDKALLDIPAPTSGTVARLGAAAGEQLQVGAILAVITDGPPAATAARRRVKAAPAVRKLAAERGVDLAQLAGTGPGGRVTREDVLASVQAGEARAGREQGGVVPAGLAGEARAGREQAGETEGVDRRVPLRGLRRETARRMTESWRSIPHITDYREVDATALLELRAGLQRRFPERAEALTFVPVVVKVVAVALRRHPMMNSSIDEHSDEIILRGAVNIGVATSTAEGLLVPVIRDADTKSVLELAEEIRDLVDAARARTASLEQLTGGTYTVNNLGALGGWMGTPIIRPPEAGILGFGRVQERAVARDGTAVVCPVMMLSSVADHRVVDGDVLSGFTTTVAELLEQPATLLAELR